jgi:hypothetical protein
MMQTHKFAGINPKWNSQRRGEQDLCPPDSKDDHNLGCFAPNPQPTAFCLFDLGPKRSSVDLRGTSTSEFNMLPYFSYPVKNDFFICPPFFKISQELFRPESKIN